MRKLLLAGALLAALLPGSALAQNQGNTDYMVEIDNPVVTCAGPAEAGTKVEGIMGTTVTFISDAPLDKITVKSGSKFEVVSAFVWFGATWWGGWGATFTLTQDVSNYIPWTCPPEAPNTNLNNGFQET